MYGHRMYRRSDWATNPLQGSSTLLSQSTIHAYSLEHLQLRNAWWHQRITPVYRERALVPGCMHVQLAASGPLSARAVIVRRNYRLDAQAPLIITCSKSLPAELPRTELESPPPIAMM